MSTNIKSVAKLYINGIQLCHFWPKIITMSLVATCFTISLLVENPGVKSALAITGFFGLGILGLKKNT